MQVSGLRSTGETDNPDTGQAKAVAVTPDDTAARDARFELRDDLRAISALERLRDCGLSVLSGGVVPVIRNGRAGFAGVVTCGSVHVCPCCSTSIRRVRQEELDQVGQFWECQSCGLVMMTLTMRHFERQPLALLVEQQVSAWRIGFGQNAGRTWRQAKVSFAIRGFVRAWEVTHGANGWHAHYHVLLFLARPLARPRVEELQHIAFEVWAAALVKVGAYMPVETGADGKPVAVRIDAPDRGESGQLARYLMKGQDGKTRWGVAAELTRLDVKTGSGGHRTPFEIARAAVLPDADPRDIALYREFERTATGMRSLYWSNGLRALLKEMGFELDDRTDAGVAAEEAAAGTRLAMIPAATWYRHIARHKGRALALLRAAERLGVVGVRTLVESWGLVWGADVMDAEELPDPRPGDLPTAADVLRQRDRAARRDRAEFWRHAFAQLDIEAEARRFAADPDAAEYRQRAEAAKRADERRATAAAEEAAAVADDDRKAAGEEFLRRRRIANAERAADRAAALERVRQRTGATPEK
ncbi:MAG: protein rep [Nonomuraea sp.]|nr:protein rep [Nonomuraea sp.]NUS11603.1 protein rep [Streptomyces sp.]